MQCNGDHTDNYRGQMQNSILVARPSEWGLRHPLEHCWV